MRDAARTPTISRICFAAVFLERGLEAFDQGGCGEWLGQAAPPIHLPALSQPRRLGFS
jgi:hypothetical protein